MVKSEVRIKNWKKILERFSACKILVWGDPVLDEYLYGEVWRFSREAPVPVLRFRRKEYKMGGAANSANNIASLGAKVYFWGWVGNDEEGRKMLSLLRKKNIDTEGIEIKEKESIVKTRIMAYGKYRFPQQVVRIDKGEEIEKINKRFFFKEWERIKKEIDAVLISDYGYGSVNSSLYEELRKDKKIWVIDSRFSLKSFRNPTVITPNEEEAMEASGLKDPIEGAKKLKKIINADSVILTLGNKGMAIFEKENPPYLLDVYGKGEIVDVTGAGDTVAGLVTLSLASGADVFTSAKIANVSAGIVVLKPGVSTLSKEEIEKAL